MKRALGPSTQILIFNIILQQKESGLLGGMADTRTVARKTDEPGASYSTKK